MAMQEMKEDKNDSSRDWEGVSEALEVIQKSLEINPMVCLVNNQSYFVNMLEAENPFDKELNDDANNDKQQ